MSQTRANQPLRWVSYPASALADALSGPPGDTPLDLRHDAYGFGVHRVAPLARDVGWNSALFSPEQSHAALQDASTGDDSWVMRAHERGAQVLSAQIVHVKQVPAGEDVSYGGYYRTQTETTLALAAIGFADGVPRLDPVGGWVEWSGHRLPIAGRIAMDQLIVDAGSHTPAIGDSVTIWGGAVTLAEWAQWSTRPVGLLGAGLGERVRVIEDPR